MNAAPTQPWTRRHFLTGSTALAAAAATRPLLASIAHGSATPAGADTPAAPQRLSDGWEYYQGPMAGPWEVWHAEELAVFAPVTVPHSFNAYDGCDPDTPYYRGHGWYRTRLKVANPFQDGRTLLHFFGSGQVTTLYVGETEVMRHEGGYDEWVADITDAAAAWLGKAKEAEKAKGVPVSVLCDNARNLEIIPSDFSDFSLYGGLYRAVELVYVPSFSIERVEIDVADASSSHPQVNIASFQHIAAGLDLSGKLRAPKIEVRDAEGRVLPLKPVLGGDAGSATWSFNLSTPHLWSTRTPYLYTCVVTVYGTGNDSHTVTTRFGIRHYEFVEHGPFKLNGERLLLRGTHRHEDHAGYANAMPDDLIREEMRLIKAMGANFIRLAHYQQNRLVLEMCDELGLLVWEELPWCRAGVGDDHWKAMSREKMRNMIAQHRNHPSVILWGLGNEDDWPTEYPQPLHKTEKDAIRAWMTEMRDLAHQLDPSRLTSFRRCDFARDIPDVYSPSIWAGWYSGLYTEYEASLTKERERVKRLIHIEYGADSLAGRHAEVPNADLHVAAGQGTDERGLAYKNTGGPPRISRDGDWSESYACDLFDWHLKTQEALPWLTGAAQWIFKDFTTPLRPENPIPRINMKGVITRDMQRKESYFVYQSYWAEEPMVHLYGHTWPVRWGAEGEERTVKVYSNCDEVELFHEGKSLGGKRRNAQDFPAAGLRWRLPFAAGENHLRAVGKRSGKTVTDEIQFTYETRRWGAAANFALRPERIALAGKLPAYTVEATLHDGAGMLCLDSRARVRFSLAGAGKLVDNQGTPWGSREVELANGRARITVQLFGASAQLGITAKDLPPAYLLLKGDSDHVQQAYLSG